MPRYRAKSPQMVRCIALLVAMASAKRGVQLRPFYARRAWNTRTAYRDLEVLRAVGAPVEEPERGWYRVPSGWVPPATLNVSNDELSAIALAAEVLSGLRDTAVGRALQQLRAKLGAQVSTQGELQLELVPIRPRSMPAIDYGPHRATFATMCGAIERCTTVRLVYRDAHGAQTTRTIEPGFLHHEPTTESLYVIAWCRTRDAVRTFALHRIEAAEALDEKCARRGELAVEMANALRVWTRSSTEHVVLRFAACVAREVRERRWHASERMRDLEDGGIVLELDIASPEELERTLLGYADDVEVLEPERLARRLHARHAAAATAPRMPRFPALHARRPDGEGRVAANAVPNRVIR